MTIRNALIVLRDGSLTASMASNAAPALDALVRLEEQFDLQVEASRQHEAAAARLELEVHRLNEQFDSLHRAFERYADSWDATGTTEVWGPWRVALNPASEPERP